MKKGVENEAEGVGQRQEVRAGEEGERSSGVPELWGRLQK